MSTQSEVKRSALRPEVRMRAEPVCMEGPNLLISGFAEAAIVLRGGPGWSNDPWNSLHAADLNSEPSELSILMDNMVLKDPPEHTRLRALLRPAFLPKVIERLRPRVVSVVNSLLDGLEGQDEADIATDFAPVVSLSVMAELLDVGLEGAELFMEHSPGLLRFAEYDRTPEDSRIAAKAVTELRGFLTPIIDQRRREPGEDFLSVLANTDGLTTEEILSTIVFILTAGGTVTGGLISNAALAILRDPAQIPALLANPKRAADELIRLEGTSKRLVRIAIGDHEIGGHKITKGQAVMIDVLAANRDPRHAPDADKMNLSREPLAYLTFGNGPHYCLGAGLAQLEVAETLAGLFTRFPQIRLTDREPVWLTSTSFRWVRELPVRLR